nr:ribonuclease III [Penaeicola halotolerans]
MAPYRLAMQHASVAKEFSNGVKDSNERLEYLGDAVLGAVVAEYLFKKYPFKDEGFLTETRSRIVNRESLNQVGIKIGLSKILSYDSNSRGNYGHKSIHGDTLEALIGAVYIDRGFSFCKKFIINRLLSNHFDLHEIVNTTVNYKSKIIEWAQKENQRANFEIVDVVYFKHTKEFKAQLLLDDVFISEGKGPNKKKAEQEAAKIACEKLNIV